MAYLIGLLIASISVVVSIVHLNQQASSYYDFVGFAMVLGGTVAIGWMIIPIQGLEELKKFFSLLLSSPLKSRRLVLNSSMDLVSYSRARARVPEVDAPGLAGVVLKDGAELINLGLKSSVVQEILEGRIHTATEQGKKLASSFRSLSKYPPAFGLAGTVLGLVHLMRGISEGMDPEETGVRMAIALVATLYGLVVSNIVCNPIGEVISKSVNEEEELAHIALQAVMLAVEKTDYLECQEILNSYVPTKDRIKGFNSSVDIGATG